MGRARCPSWLRVTGRGCRWRNLSIGGARAGAADQLRRLPGRARRHRDGRLARGAQVDRLAPGRRAGAGRPADPVRAPLPAGPRGRSGSARWPCASLDFVAAMQPAHGQAVAADRGDGEPRRPGRAGRAQRRGGPEPLHPELLGRLDRPPDHAARGRQRQGAAGLRRDPGPRPARAVHRPDDHLHPTRSPRSWPPSAATATPPRSPSWRRDWSRSPRRCSTPQEPASRPCRSPGPRSGCCRRRWTSSAGLCAGA